MNAKIKKLKAQAQELRKQLECVENQIRKEEKEFSAFCKSSLLKRGFVCQTGHKTESSGKNTSDSGEVFDFIIIPKDFKRVKSIFEWSDSVVIKFGDATEESFDDFPFGHGGTESEAWLDAFEKQTD